MIPQGSRGKGEEERSWPRWEGSDTRESRGRTAVPVLQAPRYLQEPAQSSPCLYQTRVPVSEGPACDPAGRRCPTSRLCQRELLQPFLPQPVPGEILAGDHAHHLRGRDSVRPREPGDNSSTPTSPVCPHAASAWWPWGLTSLRLSTTTKCRRPRARKSLKTRGRDASCKARQGRMGHRGPSWLWCPSVVSSLTDWGAKGPPNVT